jgi:hypothetical protein
MTTDILRDYMLGRLSGTERGRLRDRLRADPKIREALRRLRTTTERVRARGGRVEAVQRLPRQWLTLVERIVPRADVDESAPKAWLRSSARQSDDRSLTWL